MQLNDDEKRILNGELGPIAQRCMQFLFDYGKAAGAQQLVDIDGTVSVHPGQKVYGVSHYRFTQEEFIALADRGETFKVPTFASKPIVPGFIIDNWERCGTLPNSDPAYHEHCLGTIAPFIKMGMEPTFSCTDYLVASRLPSAGQHCAWVESSAIPWANAILGAKVNHDGCFEAAYLGKIPSYDMHLDENRRATVAVYCETPLLRDMDYDLFGWAAGEAVGLRVPVLEGIGCPSTAQLVKMNASLNTSGQVRMYHIPGLTPEAPTSEAAFRGKPCVERIAIGRNELRRVYDMLNCAHDEQVEFVYLGCPHYGIQDISKVAHLLKGRKCTAALWIMTSPATFKMAEESGYVAEIAQAGGQLMSGSCPGAMDGEMPVCSVMATDASKQNYYITGWAHPKKLQVWYGTTEECVDAAVTGRWRGEWR